LTSATIGGEPVAVGTEALVAAEGVTTVMLTSHSPRAFIDVYTQCVSTQ